MRDWGYAPEYVRARWLGLQHDTPLDYVVATHSAHTLRDFLEYSFSRVGLEPRAIMVDVDWTRSARPGTATSPECG